MAAVVLAVAREVTMVALPMLLLWLHRGKEEVVGEIRRLRVIATTPVAINHVNVNRVGAQVLIGDGMKLQSHYQQTQPQSWIFYQACQQI